jgi:hypothetical protein
MRHETSHDPSRRATTFAHPVRKNVLRNALASHVLVATTLLALQSARIQETASVALDQVSTLANVVAASREFTNSNGTRRRILDTRTSTIAHALRCMIRGRALVSRAFAASIAKSPPISGAELLVVHRWCLGGGHARACLDFAGSIPDLRRSRATGNVKVDRASEFSPHRNAEIVPAPIRRGTTRYSRSGRRIQTKVVLPQLKVRSREITEADVHDEKRPGDLRLLTIDPTRIPRCLDGELDT